MSDDLSHVVQCQEGDLEAFRELVERYEARVYTLACSILGDAEGARDAAQEAFVRAYQSLETFRAESTFYTWLYRIAVNVCLNRAQAESRRKDTISLDALVESGRITADHLFDARMPTDGAERAQLQEAIQAALDALESDQRAVVVLKDIEDMSQEQIAETLGCSVGTVKSRLSRARARLRDLLRPVHAEWVGEETS